MTQLTIYRRHSADCAHKDDRYAPRCGCPLWAQFQLNGKQRKKTLNARTMSAAQVNAKELEKELAAVLEGRPVQNHVTVEEAVKQWLAFRAHAGFGNTKPKLMGEKLVAWCTEHLVLMLRAFDTTAAMKFQMSLPFRTGDSSSLMVHWSVITGFFNWAHDMGYLEKNPIPNPKHSPQFKIKFDKAEVVPPTLKEIEKVIHGADGRIKLLARLMRESGMALCDAQKFGMSLADAQKYGLSKPERRPVLQDRTLIRGNRTKTNERYRVRISQSLAEQLEALGSPAFPGAESLWRERLKKVISDAGVKMTPHGFRHYRISEWLAAGVRVEDVADMVGTSPKEIYKTYRHWVKAAEDRLDEVQRQAWLAQGRDEQGNEVIQ